MSTAGPSSRNHNTYQAGIESEFLTHVTIPTTLSSSNLEILTELDVDPRLLLHDRTKPDTHGLTSLARANLVAFDASSARPSSDAWGPPALHTIEEKASMANRPGMQYNGHGHGHGHVQRERRTVFSAPLSTTLIPKKRGCQVQWDKANGGSEGLDGDFDGYREVVWDESAQWQRAVAPKPRQPTKMAQLNGYDIATLGHHIVPRSSVATSTPTAAGPPQYDYRTVGTVEEVWREYREGMDGQPAIEKLDATWGSRWRPEPRGRTWYSRRKVIWDKIKEFMAEGRDEDAAVQEVEKLRDGGTINKLIRMLQDERKDKGIGDDGTLG
ncbi:hypothetical protein NUW58_g4912 [Xylaria curta]|uniref:Uncharacterized protein n=1 Tax=Xylaria curta TaxID=42375 RepID=A0ACC1P6S3_9PEZI|nr:hypothetical protein NUW58_g4912 [Xylaria curta]